MNNKKFGILLRVINFLSIITLEKYWKNGIKFVFKKKKNSRIATEQMVAQEAVIPQLEMVSSITAP
jgi:hypothetical protein